LELSKLKIGYSPSSKSLLEPGDRRRFVLYSKLRNFTFDIADYDKDFDIVFLSYYLCDIPKWIEYKRRRGNKTKLIFEMVDSYLFEPSNFKSMFRGLSKYLDGTSSKLYFDYKNAIIEIVKIADAVICTTIEQKNELEKYNSNIHLLLDLTEKEVLIQKEDFITHNKLKIVWEGMAYTLHNMLIIKDVLNELKDKIELHIITDEVYYKYSKKYFLRKTANILDSIECSKTFYEWNNTTFSKNIVDCDLAIIPIDLNDTFASGKPENKLILFWQHNIPVLTSGTPSYIKTMHEADLSGMHCMTPQYWLDKIMQYYKMPAIERSNMAKKGFDFAKSRHSLNVRMEQWDKCFMSVL
jgi:hypothetical protein